MDSRDADPAVAPGTLFPQRTNVGGPVSGTVNHCHGITAVAGASVPDLRYTSAETHEQCGAIVLAGTHASRAMPSFKDTLKPAQVRAIEAYVLARAAASAAPPTTKAPAVPSPPAAKGH